MYIVRGLLWASCSAKCQYGYIVSVTAVLGQSYYPFFRTETQSGSVTSPRSHSSWLAGPRWSQSPKLNCFPQSEPNLRPWPWETIEWRKRRIPGAKWVFSKHAEWLHGSGAATMHPVTSPCWAPCLPSLVCSLHQLCKIISSSHLPDQEMGAQGGVVIARPLPAEGRGRQDADPWLPEALKAV